MGAGRERVGQRKGRGSWERGNGCGQLSILVVFELFRMDANDSNCDFLGPPGGRDGCGGEGWEVRGVDVDNFPNSCSELATKVHL